MASTPNGNFAFMYHVNRDIYEKLYSVEKQARIDFRDSGHDSREVLEKFIGSVIEHHGLDSHIGKGLELYKKIEMLRSTEEMRAAGYLSATETLEDKPLLPDLGTIRFKYANEREATEDYYDFLRKFGNTCSHADTRYSDVKISYANVINCLKGYHMLMKKYYKSRISNDIPKFDEYMMPIGEYEVYESYEPADSVRSKCLREFKAVLPNEESYAILRLYNKQESSDTFRLRNQKCFTEASKQSISSVPEGMTKLREVIPRDAENTSFYMISYIFYREPHALTDKILQDMDIKKRVKMCCRIVNCLDNLHNSEIPIFHRMLNYESVYVCEFRGEWIPYIIKFDYAKIVADRPIETVIMDAVKAKARLQELKLNKYLPPEWVNIKEESQKVDWAKVDIYSLGILLSDILYGEIGNKPVALEDLEESGLSDEILDILDWMRAEDPQERCDIHDVKEIFDEEAR